MAQIKLIDIFKLIGTFLTKNNLVGWLTMLSAIASAFFALKAYLLQKKRAKKDSACDLAKCYSNSVLNRSVFITTVFKHSKVLDFVRDTFPVDKISAFDKEELNSFLSEKSLSEDAVKQKIQGINPELILNVRMYASRQPTERSSLFRDFTQQDAKTNEVKIINEPYLREDFMQEIIDLLNELEWFSMCCNYGIADEKLLYQSLHQTFISNVWMLYYFTQTSHTNKVC
ncbi:MAG: hypothetical protein J6K84_05140 [Oscillospiraceae bacterium]|nr:hypothetical protein [Oscillospiraceae bacterium]